MAQKALSFPAHSRADKKAQVSSSFFLGTSQHSGPSWIYTHTVYSTHSLSLLLALGKCTATLWEKKSWRGIKQSHSLAHYLCRTKSAAATHKTQTLTEPVEIIMKTERNRHTRIWAGKKASRPSRLTDCRADCVELKKKRERGDGPNSSLLLTPRGAGKKIRWQSRCSHGTWNKNGQ